MEPSTDRPFGHPAPYAPGILPVEIWLEILHHLDYPSALKLSETSRLFHSLVHAPSYGRSPTKAAFLAQAEGYTRYNADHGPGLACFRCMRIRPGSAFSYKMHRRASHGGLPGTRVCVDCGLRTGLYGADRRITLGGRLRARAGWCETCRRTSLFPRSESAPGRLCMACRPGEFEWPTTPWPFVLFCRHGNSHLYGPVPGWTFVRLPPGRSWRTTC